MKENQKHIYPIFDKMLTRMDKERLLKQHGLMLWFTGLSGSGKSTQKSNSYQRFFHNHISFFNKANFLYWLVSGYNLPPPSQEINSRYSFFTTKVLEMDIKIEVAQKFAT